MKKKEKNISMSMHKTFVALAVARGKASEESNGFPKYIGVAPFTVVAVNPNKKELADIYAKAGINANIEREPEYISTNESGKRQIRIDIWCKSVPESCEEHSFLQKVTYFLKDEPRANSTGDKFQAINTYGETTWLTKAEISSKTVPDNQKWYSTEGLRPAYSGEDKLVTFIKAHQNVPAKSWKDGNGEIKTIDDLSKAWCQLEKVKNYFTGDVSELKTLLTTTPTYKVKVLLGVKTTADNKQYQDVFTDMPIKNGITNYTKLGKRVDEVRANGGYPSTEFGTYPFAFGVYKDTPTNFSSTSNNSGMPEVSSAEASSWLDEPML